MQIHRRAALIAGLLVIGLIASSCGSSGDDSAKATTTTAVAAADEAPDTTSGAKATPSVKQSCTDMAEIVGVALRLAFQAELADKKADTAKILELLKVSTNRAPAEIQAPMLVSAVYYKQVVDATAAAKDKKDYEARLRTVARQDQDKAADLALAWFQKNCQ